MANCKECIHHDLCDVHGELLSSRKDVDKICEHYQPKDKPVGFNEFWGNLFNNAKR